MSIILEALKKLDRERSSRRDRTANIAADLLGADLPPPGKRIRVYVATVFLTAFAATVITYIVIVQLGFLSKSSSPFPVSPHAGGREAASAPPSRDPSPEDRFQIKEVSPGIQGPVTSQQRRPPVAPFSRETIRDDRDQKSRLPSTLPSPSESKKTANIQIPIDTQLVPPALAPFSKEPVRDGRDEIGQELPKIEKPAESKKMAEKEGPVEGKRLVTLPEEKRPSPNVLSGKGDIPLVSAEKTAQRKANFPPVPGTSLKISGIVWHEEPSKRLAVINGMITNEGSVVEGIKVLEIHPDRVRFSQEDLSFEIPFR